MSSAQDRVRAAELTNTAYQDVGRGDMPAARTKLEQALKLCDDIADTHSEYALVLLKFKQPDQARPHILRSIELSPRNPKFWLALAMWHFQVGELDQATLCVLVAEEIDPNFPTVPVAKMHILNARKGNPSEVARLAEEARQFYNARNARADGSPLRMGDVERFLTLRSPR